MDKILTGKGLGAIGTVLMFVLVAAMYAAFIWKACGPAGIGEFLSSVRAFHTRDGC